MTAFVPLALWADELAVRVPGAVPEACRQALRGAFNEFCTQTGAWVIEATPMDAVAGQEYYTVDMGEGQYRVAYILAVSWQDSPDHRTFLRARQAMGRPNQNLTPSDRPHYFTGQLDTPGTFKVWPIVAKDVPDAIRPWVSVTPAIGYMYDEIPEFVATPFYEVLMDGACGRMMVQQGKPYSNQTGAIYHLRRFRSGMAQARDVARRQFTTSEADFLFPQWTSHTAKYRY